MEPQYRTPYEMQLEFSTSLATKKWTVQIVNVNDYDLPTLPQHALNHIAQRVQTALEHHPQLLAGHSLAFRYNQYRVFVIPQSKPESVARALSA